MRLSGKTCETASGTWQALNKCLLFICFKMLIGQGSRGTSQIQRLIAGGGLCKEGLHLEEHLAPSLSPWTGVGPSGEGLLPT